MVDRSGYVVQWWMGCVLSSSGVMAEHCSVLGSYISTLGVHERLRNRKLGSFLLKVDNSCVVDCRLGGGVACVADALCEAPS